MSKRTISGATPNAISSLESVDGVTPCVSLDGPTKDLFGQEVVLANHSAAQAGRQAIAMSATYGRIGEGSLNSQALQKYLENKLQALLPLGGGMKWPQTWKRRITPARRLYCLLALLARRTKEIDCSLWPTPNVVGYRSDGELKLLAPKVKNYQEYLGMSDRACQSKRSAFFPTPTVNDSKNNGSPSQRVRNTLALNCIAGGKLNPKWVAWLMGFTEEHNSYAPTATLLSRKSRKLS